MCVVVALMHADSLSPLCHFISLLLLASPRSAAYRFLFDGNRVNDTDTPESLEMVRCLCGFFLRCPRVPVPPHGGSVFYFIGLLARHSRPSCLRDGVVTPELRITLPVCALFLFPDALDFAVDLLSALALALSVGPYPGP